VSSLCAPWPGTSRSPESLSSMLRSLCSTDGWCRLTIVGGVRERGVAPVSWTPQRKAWRGSRLQRRTSGTPRRLSARWLIWYGQGGSPRNCRGSSGRRLGRSRCGLRAAGGGRQCAPAALDWRFRRGLNFSVRDVRLVHLSLISDADLPLVSHQRVLAMRRSRACGVLFDRNSRKCGDSSAV
jgi:hypothetical protein